MSEFLSDENVIKKLIDQKLELDKCYLPFLIDSDGMMEVKQELKKYSAIRRF